jgi:pectate lyase
VVAEGNYFDSVNNPGRVDFSGDLGRMVERDNILVDCNHAIETRGSVTEPRTYYSYTADRAADVPTIVPAGAGVGKVAASAAAGGGAAGLTAAANTVDGFASVNALGQNGTTGGVGGPVVTVRTTDELLEAIDTVGPMIIQVSGRIAIESKQGVRPNKTVIGLGTTAEITGGGLDFYRSYNVIVRNIKFTNAEDDAVNIGQNSHHIWVDHNEFVDPVDGAVDIVRGAEYVTVSWNWFNRTDKTMLIGHSDGATSDVGHLKVSIHHNYFDGSVQRHPRVRFGEPVHVYNNYFRANSSYGVATTMNAGVLVEGNYFENVPSPILVGYADSGPGRVVQRDNIFAGSGTPQTAGTVVEPRTYYAYTLDAASSVPAIVPAGVGVGRT